ncbi:hypothetical protein GCM10028895_55550 [Pontibacter rugosus]
MAKNGGRRTILEHLGSAHTDSELAALMQVARDKLDEGQEELDLGWMRSPAPVAARR